MVGGAGPSTASLHGALREPIARIQRALTQAQTELSTGRHADLGPTLGARAGAADALHQARDRLDVLTQTNALATTRLGATQDALGSILQTAQDLQKTVVAALNGGGDAAALAASAKAGFAGIAATLNTSVAGQYVFAGVDTDSAPLADNGASGLQAITDAFRAAFGVDPSDPAASAVSAADMRGFLHGAVASSFTPSGWRAQWSSASDEAITSRISPTRNAATSVSANEASLREVAQAFAALAQLGSPTLAADTRGALLTQASGLLGDAISGVAALQSRVGLTQTGVREATDDAAKRQGILSVQIGAMEEIDPAEVSTRISTLTTQLEAAYSLTARISQLSLVRFLST